MKTFVMVEPIATGHRPYYLVRILSECLLKNVKDPSHVWIFASPEFFEHPTWKGVATEIRERIHCVSLDNFVRPPMHWQRAMPNGLRWWVYFARIGREYRDLFSSATVIVPYSDYYFNTSAFLGLPFHAQFTVELVIQSPFGYLFPSPYGTRFKAIFKALLFSLALKWRSSSGTSSVGVIDPVAFDKLAKKSKHGLFFLPDPIAIAEGMTKECARVAMNIPRDANVVLVYGYLDDRKGIRRLLQAALRPMERAITILMVGAPDPELFAESNFARACEVLKRSGRLHSILREANDAEERLAFSAADVVWVGYERHFGMSGVLALAGGYGKPVIGCSEGLIGYIVAREHFGVTCEVRETDKVCEVIEKLLDDVAGRNEYGRAGIRYFERHKMPGAFSSLVQQLIRER